MDYLLGIDVSTTASKAILLSDAGKVVAVHSSPHSLSAPKPLWSEQDPAMWWDAVASSVSAVVRTAGAPADAIKGIGLTGQMHGLVLLDEHGEIIRPAILWDDQRSVDECTLIRERFGLDALVRMVGNDAFPGFTLPKLLWVKHNEPANYARVAHVLLPKDYIRFRLTGAYATDKAGAGGTLMLDLNKRTWSAEITSAFDVPSSWLPDTFEGTDVSATLRAEIARDLGLSPGTPVVGGAGDQAAQAVGVGVVAPGDTAITVGTSGVVFAASDRPITDPKGAAHAFPHAIPGCWHMMGVMLSAAGSLRWYHDAFARDVEYDALVAEAATVPPGSDGLVFMPYLSGERTPHADPWVRGAFVGLTQIHGRAHVTRSVLEGVAFGLCDNVDLLMNAGLPKPDSIRISGGGARSVLWVRIIADILDVPLETVESPEGAALGAAMLAGIGTGVWNDAADAIAKCVRTTGVVEPDQTMKGAYKDALARFRDLYAILGPTYAPKPS